MLFTKFKGLSLYQLNSNILDSFLLDMSDLWWTLNSDLTVETLNQITCCLVTFIFEVVIFSYHDSINVSSK